MKCTQKFYKFVVFEGIFCNYTLYNNNAMK